MDPVHDPGAALDAACQLQRDTCLMTSNISILDQYAICLHGMGSDLLQLVVGRHEFPAAVMDTAAPVPRVCHAFMHMEDMGPRGACSGLCPPGPFRCRLSCLYAVSAWLGAGSFLAGRENSFCVYGLMPCKYVAGC